MFLKIRDPWKLFLVYLVILPSGLKVSGLNSDAMKRIVLTLTIILTASMMLTSQVKLGDKVPNFSATNQDGEQWVLKKNLKESDYLVVYFYPAAFTGGCTAQACSFRDQKAELASVGASVVGVSGDKPETLQMFAEEHNLNFTLLADEEAEIATIFGVPHGEGSTIQREIKGKTVDLVKGATIQRWTFIVDNEGTLIYKDAEVKAAEDGNKVVEFLSTL
jgi:thioredoxin-dependent peroxiredoxin